MSLTQLIQGYVDVIQRQQTFLPLTLKRYRSSLSFYAKWVCASEFDPLEPQAFVAYYEYLLNERKLQPSSIHNYFAALNNWGKWLQSAGHAPTNPVPDIQIAKKNPPVRLLITDEEVRAVLDACDRIFDSQHRLMMTALLTVLSTVALRHQEILDLRLGDVALLEHWLYVRRGKGNKKRQIALPDEAIAALDAWIKVRPTCAHDYLWVRTRTQRLGYDALNPLIAEVVAIAGYKNELPRFKAHSWRHNAATHYYRQTKDLHKTMLMLGHADIKTTQKYLHTGEEELQETRNAANRRVADPPAVVATAAPQTPMRPTAPLNQDLAARNGERRRHRLRSIRTQR